MIDKSIIYRALAPDSIRISELELLARLGGSSDGVSETVSRMKSRILQLAEPKFAAIKVEVGKSGDSITLFGEKITAVALKKCLDGAKSAYIMAVTLGPMVDRELISLSKRSQSEHFVLDAVSSAYVEAAADATEEELLSGVPHTKRFSPGYSDVPLRLQKIILDRLCAERLLGVTLTDESLMIPTKTITAIIGVKD